MRYSPKASPIPKPSGRSLRTIPGAPHEVRNGKRSFEILHLSPTEE